MKKILYVEDNVDTANAVKMILDGAGFETHLAFTGRQGLKKINPDFDLCLLDIMLPDMSGWDIFTKLRELNGYKFIFISAIPVSNERRKELKKIGISGYITKPFTKTQLIDCIKNCLN